MHPTSHHRVNGFVLVLLGGLLMTTGCGTSTPSSAPSPIQRNKGGVALVVVNRTAQVLAAAPGKSSSANEAVFTLTAYDAQGNPVKGAKVAYFVGQMKPLGSMMPMMWNRSGTAGANASIASYTKRTNASGKATLTLFGQPANTMEMIGVQVGSLSSFDAKTKQMTGMLDAWWIRPNNGEASVGNYVAVDPFMASGVPATGERVTVVAMNRSSGPILGASVQYTPETAGAGGMGGSNAGGQSKTTNMQGHVIFTVMPGSSPVTPVRIVVTSPGGAARVAGGMSISLFR